MKVYIAGLLWNPKEQKLLEAIDHLCQSIGIQTYLPHRDTGIYQEGMDSSSFFKKNKEMLDWCDVVVAILDWKGIGSGTAWELGYAFAKNKKIIGLVEDKESVSKEFRTCVMCFNAAEIVEGEEALREALQQMTQSPLQSKRVVSNLSSSRQPSW